MGAKRGTAGGAGAEMWRGAGPLRAELRGSGLDLKGSGAAVWGRSVRGGAWAVGNCERMKGRTPWRGSPRHEGERFRGEKPIGSHLAWGRSAAQKA